MSDFIGLHELPTQNFIASRLHTAGYWQIEFQRIIVDVYDVRLVKLTFLTTEGKRSIYCKVGSVNKNEVVIDQGFKIPLRSITGVSYVRQNSVYDYHTIYYLVIGAILVLFAIALTIVYHIQSNFNKWNQPY